MKNIIEDNRTIDEKLDERIADMNMMEASGHLCEHGFVVLGQKLISEYFLFCGQIAKKANA